MKSANFVQSSLKYLKPDTLYEQIKNFTSGMHVTKGSFELIIEQCTLEDLEWNHMDQMHRPTVHNTYEKGVRIALGKNFAVSLTQWGKWPFFITVSDVYVARGLFYQSLVIGGFIFLHSIISMEEQGDNCKLKCEWFIGSHKLLRFCHKFLDKKLYSLNKRLQDEDEQIRQGRFELRKTGYKFTSDPVDYYSSNILTTNTIYPPFIENAYVHLSEFNDACTIKEIAKVKFILKKEVDKYLIWPAACPHEGGPLMNGKFCGPKVTCPWHGLHFYAAELSIQTPRATKYSFEYELNGDRIYIKNISASQNHSETLLKECSSVV